MRSGTSSLWEFVPLSEWSLPREPARESIRHDLRSMVRWLFRRRQTASDAAGSEPGNWLSEAEARSLLPALNWSAAAEALSAALDSFEGLHLAVVGPPGSGAAEVLRHWARLSGALVVEPPSPGEILSEPRQVLERMTAAGSGPDTPVVIPNLERFYLRHALGLELTRRLLQTLHDSSRPVLAGCDSWAWDFLDHVVQIRSSMDQCLTLADWNGERLDAWLRQSDSWQRGSIVHGSGRLPVCEPPPRKEPAAAAPPVVSRIVQMYAAASRGNPGVAAALLAAGLRCDDDDPGTSPCVLTGPDEADLSWIRVTQAAPLRIVLHTLLLHNGLEARTLMEILPLERSRIQDAIHQLAARRILVQESDRWQVSLAVYPSVRGMLAREGFFTDAF